MSRLTDLLREVERKDARLAADLAREYKILSERRAFGLNFERHVPETVELPGRPIRRGDKVRFLPERGTAAGSVDKRIWRVASVGRTRWSLRRHRLDGQIAEPEEVDVLIGSREQHRRNPFVMSEIYPSHLGPSSRRLYHSRTERFDLAPHDLELLARQPSVPTLLTKSARLSSERTTSSQARKARRRTPRRA